MKIYFKFFLLLVILFSCSKNKQDNLHEILPDNQATSQESKYFSQHIKYECNDLASCENSVELVLIRQEDKIIRCTGVRQDVGVYFDSTCLSEEIDLTNDFCQGNIEIQNISKEIRKCEKVSHVYTSTDGVKYFKIESGVKEVVLDTKEQIGEVQNYYIKNDTQFSRKCEESFTSILNFKSLSINSEFLDYKNCEFKNNGASFKNGELLSISSSELQDKIYTSLNAKCLFGSCERKRYSKKDKAIRALQESELETVRDMINYILSGRELEMQDYKMTKAKLVFDEEELIFSVIPDVVCRWDYNPPKLVLVDIDASLSLNDFFEIYSDSQYKSKLYYGYNPDELYFLSKKGNVDSLSNTERPTVLHEGSWYEAYYPSRKYHKDDYVMVPMDAEYGRANNDRFAILGSESSYPNIISMPVCR